MKVTGTQSLEPGVFGWKLEDGLGDQGVRCSNGCGIHTHHKNGNRDTTPDVRGDLHTGQPGYAHALAVDVREELVSAEGQGLHKNNNGENGG